MRILLLLLVALLAGSVIYPRYAENADTVCAAFEHKLNSVAQMQLRTPGGVIGRIGQNPQYAGLKDMLAGVVASSRGMLAHNYVRQEYPMLPPVAGCAAAYWRLSFDPDLTPYLRRQFGLGG